MTNPWFEVLIVHRRGCGAEERAYVRRHQVVNRAGTRLSFTTNSVDGWGSSQAMRCETFFIHATETVGHRKANPARKHAHIVSDIIAAVAPFGLVRLPVYHPIWDEPRDNFERLTFFPDIKRDVIMNGGAVSYEIAPPPAHLIGTIAHHTSFGSTALNDHEATLLKLGLQ